MVDSAQDLRNRIAELDRQLENPPQQSAEDVNKWRARLQTQRSVYSDALQRIETGELPSDVDTEIIATESLTKAGQVLGAVEETRRRDIRERAISEKLIRYERGKATEQDIKYLKDKGMLQPTSQEQRQLEQLEKRIKSIKGTAQELSVIEYNLIARKYGGEVGLKDEFGKVSIPRISISPFERRKESLFISGSAEDMTLASEKDLAKALQMDIELKMTPYKTGTLVSGLSMTPYIPPRTKLALEPYTNQSLAVGDIITFKYPKYAQFGYEPYTTHRIFGITSKGKIIARGDANRKNLYEFITRGDIRDIVKGKIEDGKVKSIGKPPITDYFAEFPKDYFTTKSFDTSFLEKTFGKPTYKNGQRTRMNLTPAFGIIDKRETKKKDMLTGFVSAESPVSLDRESKFFGKIKESYTKLDIKLGGLLPGAISPEAKSGKIKAIIATEITEGGKPTGRRVLVPQDITVFEEFESKLLTGKARQKYTSEGITILGGAISATASYYGKPSELFLEAGREKAGKFGRGVLIRGKFALVESIPYVRGYVFGTLIAKQGGEFIKDPFKFTTETIRYAREEPFEFLGGFGLKTIRRGTIDPLTRKLFGTTPEIRTYQRTAKEYLAEKGKETDIVRLEAGTDFYKTIRNYQPENVGFELKTEFTKYLEIKPQKSFVKDPQLILLSQIEKVGKKGGEVFGSASYPKYIERLAGDIDIGRVPKSIKETFVPEIYK